MLTIKVKEVNQNLDILDNPAVDAIEDLAITINPDAIMVMGGAALAYEVMHNENGSIADFVSIMDDMLRCAIKWGWHEPLPDAMRTFCHLSFVDPMLVEVALGVRFDNIDFTPLLATVKPF